MNPNFPNLLLNGFLICLCFQLLILGVYNLYNRTYKNTVLGFFCLIISITLVYTIYLPTFSDQVLFSIFISYKHIYIPALIFLYIKLNQRNDRKQQLILSHLIPPTLVQFAYIYLKVGQSDFFAENELLIQRSINAFIISAYLIYAILVLPLFQKLKFLLKGNALSRYKLFYYAASTYGIVIALDVFLSLMVNEQMYNSIFKFLSLYFYPLVTLLFNTYILVFAFLEAPKLKTRLMGKNVYNGYDLIEHEPEIKHFIAQNFETKKVYTQTGFDLNALIQEANFTKREWNLYLKKKYQLSQTEFLNNYRLQEFKNLINDQAYLKYDLIGIAQKAGFSSKATFYRNFKHSEGITPKQYLEQHRKNKSQN